MNQRAILHDDDIVVYASPTVHALHAAVLQVYERAKVKVAANSPDWTDADGEVHERRYRLTFGEDDEDLTVKQRGFLHKAIFPQIAEQYTFPDGSRFDAKVWKEFFRARFLGYRWESKRSLRWDEKTQQMALSKRATPHKIRVSTEDLSKRLYSEYIDRVIDTAVLEYGVVFVFKEGEREGARYRKPKRKPKAESVPA